MKKRIVDVDLLKVYRKEGKKKAVITVLGWGDPILVGDPDGEDIPVTVKDRKAMPDGSIKSNPVDGFVSGKAKFREPSANDIVRFTLVDVQQGDGAVLETPNGAIMLIDGGENQMFARYLATRFPGTSKKERLKINAILVTHGDADHYGGLVRIRQSEKHETPYKRIFIHPELVLHNGLVKRATADDPLKAFGAVASKDGTSYVTGLIDDPTGMAKTEINRTYRTWSQVLKDWSDDGPITIKRISDRVGSRHFDFLKQEGLDVDVLSPIEEDVEGKPALPLLHDPPKAVPEAEEAEGLTARKRPRAYSVSHTVNGNSVVLLLRYGNIRLLLTGDLNKEAEETLVRRRREGRIELRADFLKAPHHGSADVSAEFLKEVNPVMSVISSGDESERVEYIHPRATLVGALGKHSRVAQPLVFVTEMVAFFRTSGYARLVDKENKPKGSRFFAFERKAYGVVHLAFSKDRMLVFTHTGKRDLKEAYAYSVSRDGDVTFDKVRQA